MIDLDLFFQYLNGRCHATDFVKKMANSALSSLWHSETEWDNAVCMHDLIAPLIPLYRVKFGEHLSSSFGGEQPDRNCVACSRLGSAYFVEYRRMYTTDFRPYCLKIIKID